MDGKTKAISVEPSENVVDVLGKVQQKIDLQNISGWALYEVHLLYSLSTENKIQQGTTIFSGNIQSYSKYGCGYAFSKHQSLSVLMSFKWQNM